MTLNRRALFASTLAAAAGASYTHAGAQTSAQALIEPLRLPASGNIRTAFLIDEQTNIVDLACAWGALASAGNQEQRFGLYTVAPTTDRLGLDGVKAQADYSLEQAPQPHVVVMGAQANSMQGGDINTRKLEWIRRVAPAADIVMSDCTGAFILARTGLIDGKAATTHHRFYDEFERQFPNVRLLRDRRFVDNGKFISAGGLTSSIDGALHLVARYFGSEHAAGVAADLEHDGDGWRTGLRQAV